jgi:hypothetical protein
MDTTFSDKNHIEPRACLLSCEKFNGNVDMEAAPKAQYYMVAEHQQDEARQHINEVLPHGLPELRYEVTPYKEW